MSRVFTSNLRMALVSAWIRILSSAIGWPAHRDSQSRYCSRRSVRGDDLNDLWIRCDRVEGCRERVERILIEIAQSLRVSDMLSEQERSTDCSYPLQGSFHFAHFCCERLILPCASFPSIGFFEYALMTANLASLAGSASSWSGVRLTHTTWPAGTRALVRNTPHLDLATSDTSSVHGQKRYQSDGDF